MLPIVSTRKDGHFLESPESDHSRFKRKVQSLNLLVRTCGAEPEVQKHKKKRKYRGFY
jgi:hypothetical protein